MRAYRGQRLQQRRQALGGLAPVCLRDRRYSHLQKFRLRGGEEERERRKKEIIKKITHHDGDLVVDFKSHLDINPLSSQFP